MDEQKQIEEMKRELKDVWIVDFDGNIHTLNEKLWDDDLENIATELYGIGYRKQIEGEWIDQYQGMYANQLYKCSVCGETAFHDDKRWFLTNYCPNCGARMKRGE